MVDLYDYTTQLSDISSQLTELIGVVQNVNSRFEEVQMILGFIFAFMALKYVLSVWRDT